MLVLALLVQIPDLSIVSVKMSDFDRFALLGFTEVSRETKEQRHLIAAIFLQVMEQNVLPGEVSTDYYYTNGSKVTLNSERY